MRSRRGRTYHALLAALTLGLAACDSRRAVPELLDVSDVVPRRVQAGDRFEVLGTGLPVGDAGPATVILRGDVFRPGERPMRAQTIEIEGAKIERDRVSVELDELLIERFCGRGEDAEHATFRGRVEVWVPGASQRMPVYGVIKGEIELDVLPRGADRSIDETRKREADEAQAFLGMVLEPEPTGGARVAGLRPGSPADRAGLQAGDVLTSFEAVRVLETKDVLPSGYERRVTWSARRGDAFAAGDVPIDGYRSEATRGLVGAIVVLVSLLVVMLLTGTRLGAAWTWLVHRLEVALSKGGEKRGLLAAIAGAVRPRAHASSDPASSVARLAPVFVAVGASAAFVSLPILELRGRVALDLALLYVVSVTSMLTMALLTGGCRAGTGPIVGRMRAVLDVLVCELPAAGALGAVVLSTGSLRVRDVVAMQTGASGAPLEMGGWPWFWNAQKSPQLFVLFVLFFVTAIVDGGAPRRLSEADAPEGDHEAPSFRRTAYAFAEWVNVFAMCAIGAIAFLGGFALPGVSPHELSSGTSVQAVAAALFLVKCWGVAGLVLLMRAALPKVRPDFIVAVGLRYFAPFAAVALGIAAVETRYALVPGAARAVGLITLVVALALSSIVVVSVLRALALGRGRADRFRARVNPIL